MKKIVIIGAGLSGCEAALQLSKRGFEIELIEMRPNKKTEAHHSEYFAEVVCSNSFKSKLQTTSSGLLKEEMKLLGCELLNFAEECSVPAGNALAIDREQFSKLVTKKIESNPKISIVRKECVEFDDRLTILATGPLTSPLLTEKLIKLIGNEQLYFFDAIAPIVSADSIDYDIVYKKTRYDKGENDYLNCPFSKEEYLNFVDQLNQAEKHEAKEFESKFFENIKFQFYENCIPIEELARRNVDTLRYGVMRPVGLEDPITDKRPFGVIQLRAENKDRTAYNLVGCQTMLKYGEQKRIFQLVPGLKKAEFHRFGSIHRNTFLNTPKIINQNMSFKAKSNLYIAGQLSGVEGYTESIFSGMLTALIISEDLSMLPKETISGSLWRYILTEKKNFQPINANFGILPDLSIRIRDKQKKKAMYSERALKALKEFLNKKEN